MKYTVQRNDAPAPYELSPVTNVLPDDVHNDLYIFTSGNFANINRSQRTKKQRPRRRNEGATQH